MNRSVPKGTVVTVILALHRLITTFIMKLASRLANFCYGNEKGVAEGRMDGCVYVFMSLKWCGEGSVTPAKLTVLKYFTDVPVSSKQSDKLE